MIVSDGLSSPSTSGVRIAVQHKKCKQSRPPRKLLFGYFVPFLAGLSLGYMLVLMLCLGNWWVEGDEMKALKPVALIPRVYDRAREMFPQKPYEDLYEAENKTHSRHSIFMEVATAPCMNDRGMFPQKPFDDLNGENKTHSRHSIPLMSVCPDRSLQLLILVLSAPGSFNRRMAIRSTWMHTKMLRKVFATTTRFLVGLLNCPKEELSSLKEEQNVYSDMLLLEDLKDSYHNLSAKVLLGLQWSQAENLNFDYLIKTDDDSYVRIKAISDALRQMKCPQMLYWGYFMGYAFPEATGKWKEGNWFKCPHYFPYAMGGGYVLSQNVVKMVTKFSKRLVLYSNEDTTMSSWLTPYRLLRKHDIRFNVESVSHGCNNRYLITHKERVKSFYVKYLSLMKNGTLCSRETEIRPAYIYNWTSSPLDCCKRIKALQIR